MMSTWDSSDVSLRTAAATCRLLQKQTALNFRDIKIDMHKPTPMHQFTIRHHKTKRIPSF